VSRLRESASVLDETLPNQLQLLHLEARALLDTTLRMTLERAREHGALISIGLGGAAELGVPLEGLATVAVLTLGGSGCSVFGRRVAAPPVDALDQDALMAAFCVAFVKGSAPVEAAGRAGLVAARRE